MKPPKELYPQFIRERALSWMIAVSVGFHVVVMVGAIVLPGLGASRSTFEPVYTVELVDFLPAAPAAPAAPPQPATAAREQAKEVTEAKAVELPETAARIPAQTAPAEVADPIPIVKSPRHLKIKVDEARTEERITGQLDRIKREVEKKKQQEKQEVEAEKRLTQALESLKALESAQRQQTTATVPQTVSEDGTGTGRGGGQLGMKLQIYKTRVWNKVRGNWSYPDLLAPKGNLEAIVLVTVTSEGQIRDYRLLKKSGNALFDQSVVRAVRLSEPFPPFPEEYVKRSEELELRFSLAELAGAS